MIDGLRPYATYKDSDVPWLGRVPAGWGVLRAKWLFKKMERPVREGDETVTCYRDGTVTLRKNRRVRGYTESLHEIGYQGVRIGDLVIHVMDAFAGAVGVSDSDGKGTPVYSVCQALKDASPHYFTHIIREMARIQWIASLAKGIRERSTEFRFEAFASQLVPVPPFSEQKLIATFLNALNATVRRYTTGKRRLLGLLEEQKRVVIHRAVTRGLDPSARLKPSGVPWLGDVPEGWEITKVKHQFDCLNTRRVPLSSTERGTMTTRKYDYYGASGVIDKVDEYIFDDDLLLIAEDGANLVLRNLPLAIIARGRFWVNNHAHILKARTGSLEYLASVMESISYLPWITGAAQPKLTKDRLMAISLAVPPRPEQDRIMAAMDRETATLRYAIHAGKREIALLTEYGTRLIADVVTGKFDVRDAAASLPDLPDAQDPLAVDEYPSEDDDIPQDAPDPEEDAP